MEEMLSSLVTCEPVAEHVRRIKQTLPPRGRMSSQDAADRVLFGNLSKSEWTMLRKSLASDQPGGAGLVLPAYSTVSEV
jgi:hypothetical protein